MATGQIESAEVSSKEEVNPKRLLNQMIGLDQLTNQYISSFHYNHSSLFVKSFETWTISFVDIHSPTALTGKLCKALTMGFRKLHVAAQALHLEAEDQALVVLFGTFQLTLHSKQLTLTVGLD
jgi:hypothetical protein